MTCYVMNYWYRDPMYNQERSGTWFIGSLIEVFAYGDMVKRYGGRCSCNLSETVEL